jgi:hypothetical protein
MSVDRQLDQKVASEFPRYIAEGIANHIRQADTKAIGTLGIIGITTGALLSRLASLKLSGGVGNLWLFLFTVSAVLILLALKVTVSVVRPRLSVNTGKDMMFFMDIVRTTKEEYVAWGKGLSLEDIISQTYETAYNLARVADNKYKALHRATFFTTLALMWTVGVLLFS